VCKSVSAVINVTRPDGIPSIDGLFLRLKDALDADGDLKITVVPVSSRMPVLTSFSVPSGQKDFVLAWGGVEISASWKITVEVDHTDDEECPQIVEIGIRGTCGPFVPPALIVSGYQSATGVEAEVYTSVTVDSGTVTESSLSFTGVANVKGTQPGMRCTLDGTPPSCETTPLVSGAGVAVSASANISCAFCAYGAVVSTPVIIDEGYVTRMTVSISGDAGMMEQAAEGVVSDLKKELPPYSEVRASIVGSGQEGRRDGQEAILEVEITSATNEIRQQAKGVAKQETVEKAVSNACSTCSAELRTVEEVPRKSSLAKACGWPAVKTCSYSDGGAGCSDDGIEKAFDDGWHGPGYWSVCKSVSAVINVTRPDGIPSIDGLFLRLKDALVSDDDLKISVVPEHTGSAVLSGFAVPGGQRDVVLVWGDMHISSETWKISVEIDRADDGACPHIVEIGFRGTGAPFVPPSLIVSGYQSSDGGGEVFVEQSVDAETQSSVPFTGVANVKGSVREMRCTLDGSRPSCKTSERVNADEGVAVTATSNMSCTVCNDGSGGPVISMPVKIDEGYVTRMTFSISGEDDMMDKAAAGVVKDLKTQLPAFATVRSSVERVTGAGRRADKSLELVLRMTITSATEAIRQQAIGAAKAENVQKAVSTACSTCSVELRAVEEVPRGIKAPVMIGAPMVPNPDAAERPSVDEALVFSRGARIGSNMTILTFVSCLVVPLVWGLL